MKIIAEIDRQDLLSDLALAERRGETGMLNRVPPRLGIGDAMESDTTRRLFTIDRMPVGSDDGSAAGRAA